MFIRVWYLGFDGMYFDSMVLFFLFLSAGQNDCQQHSDDSFRYGSLVGVQGITWRYASILQHIIPLAQGLLWSCYVCTMFLFIVHTILDVHILAFVLYQHHCMMTLVVFGPNQHRDHSDKWCPTQDVSDAGITGQGWGALVRFACGEWEQDVGQNNAWWLTLVRGMGGPIFVEIVGRHMVLPRYRETFMRYGSSCNARAFRFGNKSISVDIALVQAVYGTLTLSLPPCQFFIVLILTLSSLSRPPCTDNVNLDRGHHINECLLRTS